MGRCVKKKEKGREGKREGMGNKKMGGEMEMKMGGKEGPDREEGMGWMGRKEYICIPN